MRVRVPLKKSQLYLVGSVRVNAVVGYGDLLTFLQQDMLIYNTSISRRPRLFANLFSAWSSMRCLTLHSIILLGHS